MAFETFPIPDKGAKLDDVAARIDAQHQLLMPVVTSLFQGINGSLQSQGAALNKVVNKVMRATNGRIKQQGSQINGVASKIYSAVDGAIAEQGQQLALQSALLSRLTPPQAPQQDGQIAPGMSSFFRPPPLQGVGQQLPGTTAPSLPAGSTAPPLYYPAQPQPAPPTATPIQQTAAGTETATGFAAVVDCTSKTIAIYDLSARDNPWSQGAGAYVPVRYGTAESLRYNWMGELYPPNLAYRDQWIAIACHAHDNAGAGWPPGGDFPYDRSATLDVGYPVGDWPFDHAGNYIGI